jgi:hypothetical protein
MRHDVAMSATAKPSTFSRQEVHVFITLQSKQDQWLTNDDIAKESGVKVRTARQYTFRYVKRGLLERAETFPAYRYRLKGDSAELTAYQQRIEAAIEAFGLDRVPL